MRKTFITFLYALCLVLLPCCTSVSNVENSADAGALTYCNPLNLNYAMRNASGFASRWAIIHDLCYREAADPSIVIHQDTYYLFTSVTPGYWSSKDLVNWEFIKVEQEELPILYWWAPTVVNINGTIYITRPNSFVYKTDNPADPRSWELIPDTRHDFGDPQYFYDEDLKQLWITHGCDSSGDLFLVQIDMETMKPMPSTQKVLHMPNYKEHGWERCGREQGPRRNNTGESHGYVEGPQLLKHGGKYYFIYSCSQLTNEYALGVYVSDKVDGNYEYAPYSPFSQKMTGFTAGAAHGEVFKDLHGNYWSLTCQDIYVIHGFERRINMVPAGFTESGQINADNHLGDYPLYVTDGKVEPSTASRWTGWHLLSRGKKVETSSTLASFVPRNAVDEDICTWWSAESSDAGEWISIDLGKRARINALQVNFAEQDITDAILDEHKNDTAACFKVYGSDDGKQWKVIIDESGNTKDAPHYYKQLDKPAFCRFLKVENVKTAYGGKFAIRDIRAFGTMKTKKLAAPAFSVALNPADARSVKVSWDGVDGADGYVVRYGLSPETMFLTRQVYDSQSCIINSLNKHVKYYYTVDVFNEGHYVRGTVTQTTFAE